MLVGFINIPMLAHHFSRYNDTEPIADIHVREVTIAMLIQSILATPIPYPKGLSVSWRAGAPVKLCGFPLVITEHPSIQPGGFLPRPKRLLEDSGWIDTLLSEKRAHEESKPKPEDQDRDAEFSSDFIDDEGQTPTDVLIKATTNCDDVRAVAVFKVSHDGHLEIESNMRRYEILGMLQDTIKNMMMM